MKTNTFTLLLLGLARTGCREGAPEITHEPATPVRVATAQVEPLPSYYHASGTVRGQSSAVITAKATGRVQSVLVHPGDAVEAGTLLLTIEGAASQASVQRARANLAAALEARAEAEFGVEQARAAARNATSTFERMKQLFGTNAISRQQLDDAEEESRVAAAQTDMASSRLRSRAASVAQAEAAVAEAQAILADTRVTAPFTGRILERRVDPGALATPQTSLFLMSSAGVARVEVAVEAGQAATIDLGDVVSIELDTHTVAVTGKVVEIVPSIDPSSRTLLVKIDLPSDLTAPPPGTFARVAFAIGTAPHLVVPTDALSRRGSLDRVFVVDDGTARLRMVAAGPVVSGRQTIHAGLEPNELVIAPVPDGLRDGERVAVQP